MPTTPTERAATCHPAHTRLYCLLASDWHGNIEIHYLLHQMPGCKGGCLRRSIRIQQNAGALPFSKTVFIHTGVTASHQQACYAKGKRQPLNGSHLVKKRRCQEENGQPCSRIAFASPAGERSVSWGMPTQLCPVQATLPTLRTWRHQMTYWRPARSVLRCDLEYNLCSTQPVNRPVWDADAFRHTSRAGRIR